MNISEIQVIAKKYDREKQLVILNLILFDTFEVRGYRTRYTVTKNSPDTPVWVVSPPAIKLAKAYFHIVRCLKADLWTELEKKIIKVAVEFTDSQ